jgi:uncharacterized protein (TIGR01777 family)
MKILLAGSSGFIGSKLLPTLRERGFQITTLVRRATKNETELSWNPRELSLKEVNGYDAVINLCGSGVADRRWSAEYRQEMYESRIMPARTISKAILSSELKPKVVITASGTGYYGYSSPEILSENSPRGKGYFAELAGAWERESNRAASGQTRVIMLRMGMVLGKDGGVLAKMLPIFRLGLGGPLGDGQHFSPWVSVEDVVSAIIFCLENQAICGPVNIVSRDMVTNEQFTEYLAKSLRRPARLPVPRFALELLFGKTCARELLLSNLRVWPEKLLHSGFSFSYESLKDYL